MAFNPSLQPWVDFDHGVQTCGENPYSIIPATDLQPCSAYGQNQNCSFVCQILDDLFNASEPQNLLNCGMWVTACSAPTFPYCANATRWTAHFESIGLNLDTPQLESPWYDASEQCSDLSTTVEGNIATCLTDYYATINDGTDKAGLVPLPCSNWTSAEGTIDNCLENLCSARTLNPDVGGIGVSTSSP